MSVDELARRVGDPDLVLLEVDERPALYRAGHLPGAMNLDWRTDLHEPFLRDQPGAAAIGSLWSRAGITDLSDVVLYGDQHNWYAAYAYWLFRMHGLRSLAVLDGGRQAWIADGRPLVREVLDRALSEPPNPDPAPVLRASAEDVVATLRAGGDVVDVRTRAEYVGAVRAEAGYEDEGAQRAGHIPGASHLPWERMIDVDGRFLPPTSLEHVLAEHGIGDGPVITYCRIGERSAHTWFVLHELLGRSDCRNYDGSWTEWGNMIGLPIAVGGERGRLPAAPVARLEVA